MGEESTAGRDTADGAAARGRRRTRRAVRRGTEREAVLGVSADERADGWAETGTGAAGAAEHGSNDERLLRDVPPHW